MKISRKGNVALGIAILGYIAFDLLQEVAGNFFALENRAGVYLGLAILLGAPLMGIILLVHRAEVGGQE